MAKLHELQAQLGRAVDELQALAGKSEADGFDQAVFDALEGEIERLKAQIERSKRATAIAANLASASHGNPDRMTPEAPPSAYKLFGELKHFHDREIAGVRVRAVDQAYAAGMWFKAAIFDDAAAKDWCQARGMLSKAQGENVDSAGGFLVPEELLANIIVLREMFGVFRQQVQVVPMGRDTLNWPRRVGGLTAYFVGENQAATESQAQWDSVNLTAKKAAVLVRMSNEIAEDALVSIADWLVGEIAYAMASKEDDCGFNGDGTSTYGGMRGISQVFQDGNHTAGQFQVSSATLSSLVVKDFTSVMGLLPQYAIANAKWYMSQQMFLSAAGTVLATGGGNKISDLQDGIRSAVGTSTNLKEPMLLGFPVILAQKLPIVTPGSGKPMFYFGDLAKAVAFGDRRALALRRSDQRYFENDQIGLLGTERFDINCHDLGDTVNAGPLVAGKSP